MKPITILIPLLAILCGCDPWARPIQREEFFDLKIKMQNELYDINMRINALEAEVFTNDIPPGTIRIPFGNHTLAAPILIKKRTGRLTTRMDITNTAIEEVQVPKGFTLITLPDGRPALVPNDK